MQWEAVYRERRRYCTEWPAVIGAVIEVEVGDTPTLWSWFPSSRGSQKQTDNQPAVCYRGGGEAINQEAESKAEGRIIFDKSSEGNIIIAVLCESVMGSNIFLLFHFFLLALRMCEMFWTCLSAKGVPPSPSDRCVKAWSSPGTPLSVTGKLCHTPPRPHTHTPTPPPPHIRSAEKSCCTKQTGPIRLDETGDRHRYRRVGVFACMWTILESQTDRRIGRQSAVRHLDIYGEEWQEPCQ